MELSKRLRAVADLVTAGYQVADIGTDHAYIPIFLTETGKTDYAVAMDVNKGPLRKAQENICAYKMEEQIETRLSDGFSALKVQEVQSAVIAGMGGNLVIRILEEGSCMRVIRYTVYSWYTHFLRPSGAKFLHPHGGARRFGVPKT